MASGQNGTRLSSWLKRNEAIAMNVFVLVVFVAVPAIAMLGGAAGEPLKTLSQWVIGVVGAVFVLFVFVVIPIDAFLSKVRVRSHGKSDGGTIDHAALERTRQNARDHSADIAVRLKK